MSAAPSPTTQLITEQPEAERRAAWLADRRTCVTGTDVAAILGVSKWSSPVQVWLDKKGLSETAENDAMRWGRRLERPILQAYSDTVGVPIAFADPYTLHRVPGFPLMGASLDAVREDRAPVDAKNTRRRGDDWGDDGTDQIPVYYAAQLAVQMMVQGTDFADLAVLFSGQDFSWFRVHRDPETESMLKERVAAWWERHVVGDVPPEVDGSDSSTEYLRKRFAKHTELTREATPEVVEWVRQRQEAYTAEKDAKALKQEAENHIKAFLGDAQAIPGLVTWKNNRPGKDVNYEGAYLALISALEQNRTQPVRDLAQRILDQHTTPTPGARVLRFSTAK